MMRWISRIVATVLLAGSWAFIAVLLSEAGLGWFGVGIAFAGYMASVWIFVRDELREP